MLHTQFIWEAVLNLFCTASLGFPPVISAKLLPTFTTVKFQKLLRIIGSSVIVFV